MFKSLSLVMLLASGLYSQEIKTTQYTWTKTDIALESIAVSSLIADWAQTRQIAKNPTKYSEINQILGPHPSTKRVDTYFISCILLHVGVVNFTPSKYRKVIIIPTIALEGLVVKNNIKLGLKIKF